MKRCLQLALLAEGKVSPNPMVGAVLVYDDVIIGEGYHQFFGGPHAEVNCFDSVKEEDKTYILHSTLYVSLEPCAHYGKTPPCADRIIQEQVKKVVIACRDPFSKVNGQGIIKLQSAGIEVVEDILREDAIELNKVFFNFHLKKRPYVFLKWAQSSDGFISGAGFKRVAISNEISNRFTHRLRSNVSAIMVGTKTALHDKPSLTTRLWPGSNPVKIIIDKRLQILPSAVLYNSDAALIIINHLKEERNGHVRFLKVAEEQNLVPFLLGWLFENEMTSLLVEGGAKLLQSFIDANLWDEAIIITNPNLGLHDGTVAPLISGKRIDEFKIQTDYISIYKNE